MPNHTPASSRLVVPPAAAVGLLALVALGGWWWLQASQVEASTTAVSTGVIPLSAPTRTGTMPDLASPEPELRDGCTHLIRLPELGAVSDKGLADHAGLFDASPLLVFEDDRALTPHARGSDCDGGFAHGPLGVFVRPTDGTTGHTYAVRASSEVQATARRGPQGPQPVLYVLPGTTLSVDVPAWRAEWGPPTVRLAAVASQGAAATLTWGDASSPVAANEGPVRATLAPAGLTGRSTVTLSVPNDGPILVVHDLIVGTGDAATAVVGTEAGLAPPAQASQAEADQGVRPAVSRVGRVPSAVLADLPAGEPSTCRYVIERPDLEALSDLRLYERYGFVSASPVRVLEDGRPLAAHDRGTGCTGAIAHPPQGIVVRPTDSPDKHAYALTYDPSPTQSVEIRGGQRTTISWVYPGTTVHWDVPELLRVGGHEVVADLVAYGGKADASVVVGANEVAIEANAGEARIAVAGPQEAPWRMSITSPEDGPIVLLRALDSRPLLRDAPAEAVAAPSQGTEGPWPLVVEGPGSWTPFLQSPGDAEGSALGGDGDGIAFTAVKAAPGSRLCSAFMPFDGDVTVQADLRVAALVMGDKPWMTASVEDGWLDAQDRHVKTDGKVHLTRFPLTEVGPMVTRTFTFPRPAGGTQMRVCLRFAQAKGRVEVTGLRVLE